MAAMETLVNIITGAPLCGQQQTTLNHVFFPEISGERKGVGEGCGP